jgi:hypothetical protein
MSDIRQIVIGFSPERPALILRRGAELARFKHVGQEQDHDGAVGRALAALQGLPDLLFAGYAGSTKLMEVQIHGDLVRAADGVGYRAFSIGDGRIVEHAKLLDPSSLTALMDVAVLWRLASIVVAQKHLSDIGATLKSLEKGVSHIAQFQRDEQASKIESAYEYLRQVEQALSHGERESAVRHRLEAIEVDMDAIQRNLVKLFESTLDTRIKHENVVGYSDIEEGLPAKLEELQMLLREHRLAGWTRVGALQMFSVFPGEMGLKAVRAKAIEASATQNNSMCKQLEQVMSHEVSQWSGMAESVITNASEFVMGQSKFHKWIKEKILPESLKVKDHYLSPLRGRTGSATPRLDALKFAARSKIHQAAKVEAKSAGRLMDATTSVNSLVCEVDEPKRYLVEWGRAGPTRILQIPA